MLINITHLFLPSSHFLLSVRSIMKNLKFCLMLIIASFVLTACNTAHGFGKDVEEGGEKIQEKTK